MRINYFAFGSNLSSKRLLQRLPEARPGSIALLHQYRLCFRKNIQGESGKCDIDFSGNAQDIVYGIIYQLSLPEKRILDGYETGGFGYLHKQLKVVTLAQQSIEALSYYAADDHGMQAPFHWYKQHVLHGAIEHQFPRDYIAAIEAIESMPDPSSERAAQETALYSNWGEKT